MLADLVVNNVLTLRFLSNIADENNFSISLKYAEFVGQTLKAITELSGTYLFVLPMCYCVCVCASAISTSPLYLSLHIDPPPTFFPFLSFFLSIALSPSLSCSYSLYSFPLSFCIFLYQLITLFLSPLFFSSSRPRQMSISLCRFRHYFNRKDKPRSQAG